MSDLQTLYYNTLEENKRLRIQTFQYRNKILDLKIPTRLMSLNQRKIALKNLQKRRQILHPVFFILSRLKKIFGKNRLELNLEQKKIVEKAYSMDNKSLFKKLSNTSFTKYYP